MNRKSSLLLALLVIACRAQASPQNKDMITQSTPSDCGPAALATLLDKYLGVPCTEQEMVTLTKARPQFGTTLLELEDAAGQKDCGADSFRMDWKTLKAQVAAFPTPVIVRTLNPEPHFSVLLGIDGDTIYMADPSAGHIMISEGAFLKRWIMPQSDTGYVFVAVGPDSYTDKDRHDRVLRRLAKQRETLQTIRPPAPAFRR